MAKYRIEATYAAESTEGGSFKGSVAVIQIIGKGEYVGEELWRGTKLHARWPDAEEESRDHLVAKLRDLLA